LDVPADKTRLAQELFHEGEEAFSAGRRQQAHMFWQQAAHLTPKDVHIWQALLDVVETDADRIICLQNILRIDPNNTHAKRHLRVLDFMQGRFGNISTPRSPLPVKWWVTVARLGIYGVVLGVLFVVGLLIGIILNML